MKFTGIAPEVRMTYLNRSKVTLLIILLSTVLLGGLLACGSEISSAERPSATNIADRENTIVLTHDGWRGSYLPTSVLRVILEEDLGYKVDVVDQQTVPNAFDSVALGYTDVFTSGWFPARDFTFSKYPNLVKLGQVYGGGAKDAFEGWMSPHRTHRVCRRRVAN